jgi:hypothetical protein
MGRKRATFGPLPSLHPRPPGNGNLARYNLLVEAPLSPEEIARYRTLREADLRGDALNPADAAELRSLETRWDAADAARFAEVAARVERDRVDLQGRTESLHNLLRKKQALAERLESRLL